MVGEVFTLGPFAATETVSGERRTLAILRGVQLWSQLPFLGFPFSIFDRFGTEHFWHLRFRWLQRRFGSFVIRDVPTRSFFSRWEGDSGIGGDFFLFRWFT